MTGSTVFTVLIESLGIYSGTLPKRFLIIQCEIVISVKSLNVAMSNDEALCVHLAVSRVERYRITNNVDEVYHMS